MRATNRKLTTRATLANGYLCAMLRANMIPPRGSTLQETAFMLADYVLQENDREHDVFEEWFNRIDPAVR